MLKYLITLTFLASLSFATGAKELTFGTAVDESALVKISTIMATPSKFLDKQVTVEGTIVGVCAKRGCWVDLASDARFEKMRIKVNDGDMVFPLTAKGSKALATGYLKAIALDLEQTRKHKAAQAKRLEQAFEPEQITETMNIYQLVPHGVKILD